MMYVFDFNFVLQSIFVALWVQFCFWLAYNPKEIGPKKFLFFQDTQKRLWLKVFLIITFVLLNLQRRYLFSLEF